MSKVSGVTLICSIVEGEDDNGSDVLATLHAFHWFRDNPSQRLVALADEYGGGKHPQLYAFGGGFNSFPEDQFVRYVQDVLPWQERENLVVVIQPEEGATRIWKGGDRVG